MFTKIKKEDLTNRELDVLLLIHLRDGEIAAMLGVSPYTVKTHLTSLRMKFCTSSKIETLLSALKSGVITIDEIELDWGEKWVNLEI